VARSRLGVIVRLLVLAFVLHVFVLPQLGGARAALDRLASISPGLLVAAGLLEALSFVSFALLLRRMLGERSPSLGVCTGVVLASSAVNHVVPGGAATTAAVNYRLFGRAGIPAGRLGFVLATSAIGSAVVLNLIFWLALAVSIPLSGFHPVYAPAAGVGMLVIVGAAAATLAVSRGDQRMAGAIAWIADRFRPTTASEVQRGVQRVSHQLGALARDRHRLAGLAGLAAANWLLDASALGLVAFALVERHFRTPHPAHAIKPVLDELAAPHHGAHVGGAPT
jgi:hypothetical protein